MPPQTTKLKRSRVKLESKDVYVAFLDILGFQKLLDRETYPQTVEDIVGILQNRVAIDGEQSPGLKYLAISDTIIVTAEEGDGWTLVRKIAQVQNAFLKKALL